MLEVIFQIFYYREYSKEYNGRLKARSRTKIGESLNGKFF